MMNIFLKIKYYFFQLKIFVGKIIKNLDKEVRAKNLWLLKDGDNSYRINYKLNSESIVIDAGGFRGDWTAQIKDKYNSKIYVFEPYEEYFRKIQRRFVKCSNVKVYCYGLGNKNEKVLFGIIGDKTSLFRTSDDMELVSMMDIKYFLRKEKLMRVDLLKLNIEGGEYDVLNRLISTGDISKIKNIQVQFHKIRKNSPKDRMKIEHDLSKTHVRSWCFPWVWENWELKK